MSWHFASGGQSIGASASATVLPMKKIQGWFPLRLTGLSPCCPRDAQSRLQHHDLKASILQCSVFFMVQLSHPYMTAGKTVALTIGTFVSKVTSLLLDMLSRFVIAFLPRSKCVLTSWLQSLSALIWGPKKIVCHYFHFFPIYLP